MEVWRKLWMLYLGILLTGCVVNDGHYGRGGWELLGQREADFKMERERIDVGRREGRFRELGVAVGGAPVEIYDMVVIFADGNTFSPNIRHRFQENSWS
jgi:hypothetical protein